MAENKTRPTDASVTAFINAIEDPQRRAEIRKLGAVMRRATGKRPKLWGSSIVGYGTYRYRYESGREGEFMLTGYAPRKQAITVYVLPGFERFAPLMKRLGRYETGKSCLYIKRLADVDLEVLEDLVRESVEYMRDNYETW